MSGAQGGGWAGQVTRDQFGKNSGPGPEKHRKEFFFLKVIGSPKMF